MQLLFHLKTKKLKMAQNCSICGFLLKHYFRKADPVTEGVCCDNCFRTRVIPAREAKIREWRREEANQATGFIPVAEMKENSTCPSGKIGYKKKEDAEYALLMCNRSKQNGYEYRKEKYVYFCKLCGQFHLTSHDQLPSWRDRNKKSNYQPGPQRYTPVARKEEW